ncbi:MAG TPA: efflux RND transporter periplasmic adaptor subunit [Thermoanaerobaculia bacterium]|nr:efflux RND transporter periplasmic adaptor subunit [Thermoanaerobaculia bacterium]
MKKRLIIGVAAVVVIAAIVFFSIRGNGPAGEKVYVEPAKARSIEAVVTAPGEVDPKFKVNISAHVIGKIEQLYFNEGDIVRRGQKLVELEKPAFLAQRDRSRAELANRRIEVSRARAALANAELSYKRAVSLRAQGIQAQELFDRSRLDHENAKAGYDSALEGVRQAEATLIQAENDLSRTTILSPIDGKVVQLNAHEGEVVITGTMNNPGSVIAVIADLSQILVAAEVGETEVVGIRVGQPGKIHVDAVPDKEYHGKVIEIGSSAAIRQNAGSGIRYFKVKVAFDDADDRLRPGMTAQVAIVTSTAGNAVAVPIQSVVERVPGAKKGAEDEENENTPKRKYVFTVQNGKAKMIEVRTGISDATHVALLSGIRLGQEVVTGPFRTLKKIHDGDAVQVVKEETKKKTSAAKSTTTEESD